MKSAYKDIPTGVTSGRTYLDDCLSQVHTVSVKHIPADPHTAAAGQDLCFTAVSELKDLMRQGIWSSSPAQQHMWIKQGKWMLV
jgi:hypothetical protein